MSKNKNDLLILKKLSKKHRKTITLASKLDIIERYEKGDRKVKIARDLGLAVSTVTTILFNREKIKEYADKSTSIKSRIIVKQRSNIIEEMETLLIDWIHEQNRNETQLTSNQIQHKAKQLHEDLKMKKSVDSSFLASNGWFHRFKKRARLFDFEKNEEENRNMKMDTTITTTATTITTTTTTTTLMNSTNLASIITEGKYLPEQIFNLTEIILLWQKIPGKTVLLESEEEYSESAADKDYLTLLLGGNTTGDFKLKPLIVYHTENPSSLEGINKETLPVVWASNYHTELTLDIFERWFYNNFISEAHLYCTKMNLPFKILLILNSSSKYPQFLSDYHSNIKVIYIPYNSVSLLHPINEHVITVFKMLYLRHIFSQGTRIMINESGRLFDRYWKSYNIYEAIKNIARAWEDTEPINIKYAWQKICPQIFQSTEDLEEVTTNYIKTLIDTGEKLNMEFDLADIQQWLEDHNIESSNEDPLKLEDQQIPADRSSKIFTIEGLKSAFIQINAGLTKLEKMDPNVGRYFKINRTIENALSCYKEIYEEKKFEMSRSRSPNFSL